MRRSLLTLGVVAAAAHAGCSQAPGSGPSMGASVDDADAHSSPETASNGAAGENDGAEDDAAPGDLANGDATVEGGGAAAGGDAAGGDATLGDASDAGPHGESGDDATVKDSSAVGDACEDSDAPDSAPPIEDAGPALDCAPDAGGAIGPSGAPALLACTGLYSDWPSRAISPDAAPYDPGLHLWADGATKSRYIALPAGTQIDTSDMDEWTFPIGTKIWKEFSLQGKKLETRYLEKASRSGWVWTTYQWSADQTSATELTTGATNVSGTGYEIPTLEECRVCHMGRLDFVLGFEAIGLSTTKATGLTMQALVAGGWLTVPPAAPLVVPGDATSSAALGWLHANCGNACHSPSTGSLAGGTGFFMRLSASKLGSVEATDTYTTGVNKRATFTASDGGALMRIAPGNPAGSCVVYRAGDRDTQGEGIQMPPIDTHVVDEADVAIVSDWITSL
jgi:hypothetical protein